MFACGDVEGSSLEAVGFSLAGSVGYSVDSDRGSILGYSLVFPVVTAGSSLVF